MFQLIDFILHIDKYLGVLVQDYGVWIYLILFLIIFCETGLVATPFLPGDSLLFALGAIAVQGSIDVIFLFGILSVAAISGNAVNYQIGYFAGPKVFCKQNSKIFNAKYLDRANKFYEKHGGKAIVISRFIPIIRTFTPFVAGIGKMNYLKFSFYNVVGCLMWLLIFIFGGYYFGNLPAVKENFTFVILAITIISILPVIIGFVRHMKK